MGAQAYRTIHEVIDAAKSLIDYQQGVPYLLIRKRKVIMSYRQFARVYGAAYDVNLIIETVNEYTGKTNE